MSVYDRAGFAPARAGGHTIRCAIKRTAAKPLSEKEVAYFACLKEVMHAKHALQEVSKEDKRMSRLLLMDLRDANERLDQARQVLRRR